LIGTAAQAGFCPGYGVNARLGWPQALLSGAAVLVVSAGSLQLFQLSHATLFVTALVALALTRLALPNYCGIPRPRLGAPAWDIPMRIVLAAVLIVALTSLAPIWGPRTSDVLATLPVLGAILSVFAHRTEGAGVATECLRGLATGLVGFALFFFVLNILIVRTSIPLAFAGAACWTALAQATTLIFLQRK